MAIHVEEEALATLKSALETAGYDYKTNLAKLQNLISEITSGDIQGDPADDLKAKFEAKADMFKAITETIESAEDYTGVQKTKFTQLISDLSAQMK